MSDDEERIAALMKRFVGLSAEQGRKLYATLTPGEQAAMDARGLKQSWRSMRAAETRKRRAEAATQDAAAGKPPKLNAKMQKALDDANAKKGRA